MTILVKDVMSSPVLTIDSRKTALDATKLMRKHRKGFLVVLDSNRPTGVISDGNVLDEVVLRGKRAADVKIAKFMQEPIITVEPTDNLLIATRKMKDNNVHRLPVVSQGKVVGVISLTDIARTSPEMMDLLEYRLKMKESPFGIKEKKTVGICDSCDNFSDDLQIVEGEWVCEDCREDMEA